MTELLWEQSDRQLVSFNTIQVGVYAIDCRDNRVLVKDLLTRPAWISNARYPRAVLMTVLERRLST